jgi:hypothetical protein
MRVVELQLLGELFLHFVFSKERSISKGQPFRKGGRSVGMFRIFRLARLKNLGDGGSQALPIGGFNFQLRASLLGQAVKLGFAAVLGFAPL